MIIGEYSLTIISAGEITLTYADESLDFGQTGSPRAGLFRTVRLLCRIIEHRVTKHGGRWGRTGHLFAICEQTTFPLLKRIAKQTGGNVEENRRIVSWDPKNREKND